MCWTWAALREPRDQVPTKGSAPCSYSGYTVVTGHQETQPQQVLAAKPEVSWLSENPRGPQPSLLRRWVVPWGILGNDPAQSPQPALLCGGSLGHFENKADVFWRQLCLRFCCLLSRLWGYSGLSPKLLAGMLNFGNGLKAELKEEFLVSVVDSEWEGKANQLEEEERWVPPSSGIGVVGRG